MGLLAKLKKLTPVAQRAHLTAMPIVGAVVGDYVHALILRDIAYAMLGFAQADAEWRALYEEYGGEA